MVSYLKSPFLLCKRSWSIVFNVMIIVRFSVRVDEKESLNDSKDDENGMDNPSVKSGKRDKSKSKIEVQFLWAYTKHVIHKSIKFVKIENYV